MKDPLGLFGRRDDTGEMDVAALREALKQNPTGAATGAAPASVRPPRDRDRHEDRRLAEYHRSRRRRSSIIAVVILLVITGAAVFLISGWGKKPVVNPDFAGAGTTETIIKISTADGLSDIASTLLTAKVIASAEAFVQTATGNGDIAAIRPGYYKLRQSASAQSAIDTLVNPASRVGTVELIPGHTLGDTVAATGPVPGYIEQIAKAACVPLNGVSECFTTDQLWQVVRTGDLTGLGLVSWAIDRVSKISDPDRRLEGMITPGSYDVPPGNDPVAVLKSVLGVSAVYWSTTSITTKAAEQQREPYDMAVIASLVQREAIASDMPKVARVVDNRLAADMPLQFDSTVNYARAQSKIATSDADRADPNAYNTYLNKGLPPTPIGAVGPDALSAALSPAEGPWLYFVKVDLQGNSCFTATLEDHNRCVQQARDNGVFG